MNQCNLQKIINYSEVPDTIFYIDNYEINCQNILWSHVKSALKVGKNVYYFCYSLDPVLLDATSIKMNLTENDKSRLHSQNLYSDPLGWISDGQKADKMFHEMIIDINEENVVIVIDSLNTVVNYLSETDILRGLQALRFSNKVTQVLVHGSSDVIKASFISAVASVCSATVSLALSSYCDIRIKKNSGKILRSTEDFSISPSFDLVSCRPHRSGKVHKKEDKVTFDTTFSLELSPAEREAKGRLVLPHTRVQSGPEIHYTPDEGDDWDDEDPDDDLGI